MKNIILALSILIASEVSFAQDSAARPPLSYDVSASSGSINQRNYTEFRVGLNYFVTPYFNWKNSLFYRFGSQLNAASGLDSSVLATYDVRTDEGGWGLAAFVGPGVRIASENNNAGTAQAGLVLTLAGIRIGGGAQYLSYFNNRTDKNGFTLPRNETQYFITVAGGGSF